MVLVQIYDDVSWNKWLEALDRFKANEKDMPLWLFCSDLYFRNKDEYNYFLEHDFKDFHEWFGGSIYSVDDLGDDCELKDGEFYYNDLNNGDTL